MQIFDIHFLNSEFLCLFLLIPVFLFFYYKNSKKKSVNFLFEKEIKSIFGKFNYLLYFKLLLILLILSVFILLLANPNKANIDKKIKKNGIDIVLALDISGSMEAPDLTPNRLEKAKQTIIKFVEKQKTNRIGLILFAGKPMSSIPLTFDYNILKEVIGEVSIETLNQNVRGLDGTAIGDALLMGKNLLFSEKNKNIKKDIVNKKDREKVIILLTDGEANRGVDPVLVSKLLSEDKIRIFTIGIGSKKGGVYNVKNGPFIQKMKLPPLKAKKLKEIAKNTGGYFFRATDNDSLEKIFSKLAELEKNDIEIKIKKSFSEYYNPFIYTLIILILLLFIAEIKRIKIN